MQETSNFVGAGYLHVLFRGRRITQSPFIQLPFLSVEWLSSMVRGANSATLKLQGTFFLIQLPLSW